MAAAEAVRVSAGKPSVARVEGVWPCVEASMSDKGRGISGAIRGASIGGPHRGEGTCAGRCTWRLLVAAALAVAAALVVAAVFVAAGRAACTAAYAAAVPMVASAVVVSADASIYLWRH